MRARAYITHKAKESEADCQDRFSINPRTGSVAVCDGMSQSLFPKYWAEILADRYTIDTGWFPDKENVRALSTCWKSMVEHRLIEMRRRGIDTWRTENMLTDGLSAGSTLVGLRLSDSGWTCDVIGDSCLVIVENCHIKAIHSSMDPSHFDSYPDYLDSDPNKAGKGTVKTITGVFGKGSESDELLLVTDALGEFLSKIRGTSKEKAYMRDLLSVESADEFEILVDYWRREGMHNDDTTLLIVSPDVGAAEPFKRQEEWVW